MALPVPIQVTEEVDAGLVWAMAHDRNSRYRKFTVVFKEPSFENPDAAVQANGIPQLGSYYPGTSHICFSLTPQMNGVSGKNFTVIANYAFSTLVLPGNNEPWNQQPLVDYDVVRYKKAMQYDFSTADDPAGMPQQVVNFIGEPFDPSLDSEYHNILITFSKFFTDGQIDPDVNAQLEGTVNIADVMIRGTVIPAQKGLLHAATARGRVWAVDGTYYWETRYEIEVESEMPILFQNWLCTSFHYYKTANTPSSKVLYTVPSDQVTTPQTYVPSPVPRVIMKDGTPWTGFSTVPQTPPDYLTLKMHPTADWSPLLLE
jgi:hypothetical protein